MAAGHAVALFDLATRMLELCGPDRSVAADMLASLFRSATNDLGRRPPAGIMTGPFARGDVATVANHHDMMKKEEIPDALAVYLALSSHAVELAKENGLDGAAVRRLRGILESLSSSD
jgi:predicted short-subunit dehydrogenase-like oxidoreductase (DUF2520 family)